MSAKTARRRSRRNLQARVIVGSEPTPLDLIPTQEGMTMTDRTFPPATNSKKHNRGLTKRVETLLQTAPGREFTVAELQSRYDITDLQVRGTMNYIQLTRTGFVTVQQGERWKFDPSAARRDASFPTEVDVAAGRAYAFIGRTASGAILVRDSADVLYRLVEVEL